MANKKSTASASTTAANTGAGLRIPRVFTSAGTDVYNQFHYELRSSVIRNPAGDAVFEMHNVEVPAGWSQVATDILAQKYFRKAGIPQPDGSTSSETSVKQVVHRLVHCWRVWGERYGYFASGADAQAFYDELSYMLLAQMAAPNSPQWFNTGLYESYGITGPAQGHWYVDETNGSLQQSTSAYERPQPHACFILSVDDDLVGENGIMDLWVREARIFKFGSGVGTNYSNIRAEGEKLSGGGTSSGLMSFLRVGDRAAGAIKSGGTTRRAAKMVVLDVDHPEIMDFIRWKVEEERKVAALIAAGYSSDYEGEAYRTVSGQNSNNSVRVTDAFMDAVARNAAWHTTARTNGKPFRTYQAQAIWDEIAQASWACADPGLQFHTTINDWHTCPVDGDIRASNPCSEYMFLDNTACNLASLNLRKFYDEKTRTLDVDGFQHACRIWTMVLEISVLMAHYPSREIADLSYKFRTLGLGYANLGSMLMVAGIPYDSDEARAIAGGVTAVMTGAAYAVSAEMAAVRGPFEGYERNKEHMLRVMRNHRAAAYSSPYENLSTPVTPIDPKLCPEYLLVAARSIWDKAVTLGEKNGYRNAQTTVLAPTGTIGLIMDCDTTGVEPDFALVKFKKLSGGGYFKIINQAIPMALDTLGYTPEQIEAIVGYAKGFATLEGAPYINASTLKAKGLNDADLAKVEAQLPGTFHLTYAFNHFTLGEEAMQRLGISPAQYNQMGFNLLEAMGFTDEQIEAANTYICGTMTVEGAPYLKDEHLPVFDCANKCGSIGTRYIHAHGHIRMMAAAQPFISGAISKTINLPHEATWEDIKACHDLSHGTGLKAISIYRDGSKLSQPLSTKKEDKKKDKAAEAETVAAVAPVVAEQVRLTMDQLLDQVKKVLAEQGGHNELQRELWTQRVNRIPLPAKRRGWTQKNNVGGQSLYVRTGEYPDGTLGEIFIDLAKEGATLRSLVNCFAIAVSMGLQHGVPLEEYVDKFVFTRFEPAGMVDHENIKSATSIVDYIFRLLALEYLDREDLVQVPRKRDARLGDQLALPIEASPAPASPTPNVTTSPAQPSLAKPVHPEDAPAYKNGNAIIPNGNGQPNGNGNGKGLTLAADAVAQASANSTQQMLGTLMGDAPACSTCGHITIRNGTCYKCLNCGTSMGCS